MNIYGVTGYPTPNYTSESHCRTFVIPNDTVALGVFMGALWPLVFPEAWQAYGNMTPDEAAAMMQDVIWNALDNDEGMCPVLPAPYWDTYANVDDQEPEGAAEAWYGELVPAASLLADDDLTWRENLGIWAIAGFIAYAGQIGAAIAFVPFARRFVLKFRGNPLGAIAEIFIDGAKLATLDTASAEDRIKAIDVQLPDDDEEHEIWVAVGDDSPPGSSLQVIRKELSPGEVYPENLRYDADCDCIQQTYDDGDTWVDQPGQDPRHSTTYLYPPVAAPDPACQAAANMGLFFENLIGTALGVMSAGLDVLGVATAIMPVFVELGAFAILFELGLGLGASLIGLGVDVINLEFTPETYAALVCIFFCYVQPNGSVTAANLASIQSQICEELNPDVCLIMSACFLLMGEVGLSNAGTIGDAAADCSDCDDCDRCYTWYFDDGDGDWFPRGVGEGSYTGAAWVATYYAPDAGKLVVIEHDIPAGAIIKSLSPNFSYILGSTGGCPAGETRGAFLRYLNSSGDYIEFTNSELPLPTGDYPNTIALVATNTPVKIQVNIWSAECDHSDGAVTINSITITGRWEDGDFPPDNC